jgi:phosphatidylserine decarboxylase
MFWSLVLLLAVLAAGVIARYASQMIAMATSFLIGLWVLFTCFTFYFFRDPDPALPASPKAVVSPAHGTVDVLDEVEEPKVMGGRCRRISIFLSVIDVHVQKAPVSGAVSLLEHRPGKFLSATKSHSAEHNESVLLGIIPREWPQERFALRLIAGLIARRILPWVAVGESVDRGDRISLIQFGSRVDLYLPQSAEVRVKLGDKVRGGETIVAMMP